MNFLGSELAYAAAVIETHAHRFPVPSHAANLAKKVREAADELARLRSALQHIAERHDMAPELFTNDEDQAASQAEMARAVLRATAPAERINTAALDALLADSGDLE